MRASDRHRYRKEFLAHYNLEVCLDYSVTQHSYAWMCRTPKPCEPWRPTFFGRSPREAIQRAVQQRGIQLPHGADGWRKWFEIRDREIAARVAHRILA